MYLIFKRGWSLIKSLKISFTKLTDTLYRVNAHIYGILTFDTCLAKISKNEFYRDNKYPLCSANAHIIAMDALIFLKENL